MSNNEKSKSYNLKTYQDIDLFFLYVYYHNLYEHSCQFFFKSEMVEQGLLGEITRNDPSLKLWKIYEFKKLSSFYAKLMILSKRL